MKIDPPNYTQTPNDLFDKWLPLLSEAELKVLLVVIRKTFGWHKSRDAISVSQLAKFTGMLEETVINAARSLQSKGIINRHVEGPPGKQKTFYSLIVGEDSNNSDPSVDPPPSEPTPPLGSSPPVQTEAQKKLSSKETIQKKQQQAPPASAAAFKIYPCLEPLPMKYEDKVTITKRHRERKVIKAVKVYRSKKNPPRDLAAFINWAAANDIDPPKDPEDLVQENSSYAQQIKNTVSEPKTCKLDILSKTIEFIFPTSLKQPIVLSFSENGFREKINYYLKEFGFKYVPVN